MQKPLDITYMISYPTWGIIFRTFLQKRELYLKALIYNPSIERVKVEVTLL